jgi:hypothetical protein
MCKIDACTLRTLLLFLYGTGALVGEARRLLREDVDFKWRTIVLRSVAIFGESVRTRRCEEPVAFESLGDLSGRNRGVIAWVPARGFPLTSR